MFSMFNDVISQQKVNNELWLSCVNTDQKASQLLWTRCSRCYSGCFLDFSLIGVTILAEAIHG